MTVHLDNALLPDTASNTPLQQPIQANKSENNHTVIFKFACYERFSYGSKGMIIKSAKYNLVELKLINGIV